MTRQLHLNAFLMGTGHHEASWRLPESDPVATTSVKHFQHLAQIAERGTFDSLFLADGPVMFGNVAQRPSGVIEPLTLLTASGARHRARGPHRHGLDVLQLSLQPGAPLLRAGPRERGRAGWNIVTTAGVEAAKNFGVDEQPLHADRYARAAEFIDVTLKLWDSWEDDVVVADKAGGVWGDKAKIHPAAHKGKYFSVAGALNSPRSPQAYPLLVQAGSSDDGKDLAAQLRRSGLHRPTDAWLTRRRSTATSSRARIARVVTPTRIKILPGIVPVLGGTEREAKENEAELEAHIVHEHGQRMLAGLLRVPIDQLDLDSQLPDDLPAESEIEDFKSRYSLIVELGRREHLTIRQLIGRLGGGRGHFTFAGTPEQVANMIEEWFTNGAADGFNIMPPLLPSGLEAVR